MPNAEIKSIPFKEYLAVDALSSHLAKELLKSGAHYAYSKTVEWSESESKQLGRAVHSLVLEPSTAKTSYAVLPPLNLTKTADKAKKKEFEELNQGKEIIRDYLWEQALEVSKAVLESPLVHSKEWMTEQSIFWTEGDIKCKARLDITAIEHNYMADLKTTRWLALDFYKDLRDYKYDMQMAWYARAYEVAYGRRPKVFFIVVESEAPHGVVVYQVSEETLNRGNELCKRAIQSYRLSLKAGKWLSYPEEIQTI
jgi:hypothetical protein